LQLALNAFQGDLVTQWNYLLAMTVVTMIPVTIVFAFLQKHITTGVASAASSRSTAMARLELAKVGKAFGRRTVIHGVDLQIADGEFAVFVGPSGCGKSTLLRLICGLEDATEGEIRIDGARVNDVPAADRGLAMVFQSYALYPHMTVRENMAFGLENIARRRRHRGEGQGAPRCCASTSSSRDGRPSCPGGQRQRVAIGRAIVREPRIFLFDEPLSNLDAELRVSMRSEIIALHRRLATTMIYVTHDQVEAMTMADRIVVLRAGRVEQVGAPLDLYNAPPTASSRVHRLAADEFPAGARRRGTPERDRGGRRRWRSRRLADAWRRPSRRARRSRWASGPSIW
jgi:ABC-type sulfate/molybdate transport systems ATPase subunit